jgi:hypothetical protein
VLSAVSIIAIIVYVIGLPIFTLGVCVWAQRKDLLRDRDMLLVLGILYREYGAKARPFDCVRMFARIFLPGRDDWQLGLGLLWI